MEKLNNETNVSFKSRKTSAARIQSIYCSSKKAKEQRTRTKPEMNRIAFETNEYFVRRKIESKRNKPRTRGDQQLIFRQSSFRDILKENDF
jgi:hypothetical protein